MYVHVNVTCTSSPLWNARRQKQSHMNAFNLRSSLYLFTKPFVLPRKSMYAFQTRKKQEKSEKGMESQSQRHGLSTFPFFLSLPERGTTVFFFFLFFSSFCSRRRRHTQVISNCLNSGSKKRQEGEIEEPWGEQTDGNKIGGWGTFRTPEDWGVTRKKRMNHKTARWRSLGKKVAAFSKSRSSYFSRARSPEGSFFSKTQSTGSQHFHITQQKQKQPTNVSNQHHQPKPKA